MDIKNTLVEIVSVLNDYDDKAEQGNAPEAAELSAKLTPIIDSLLDYIQETDGNVDINQLTPDFFEGIDDVNKGSLLQALMVGVSQMATSFLSSLLVAEHPLFKMIKELEDNPDIEVEFQHDEDTYESSNDLSIDDNVIPLTDQYIPPTVFDSDGEGDGVSQNDLEDIIKKRWGQQSDESN